MKQFCFVLAICLFIYAPHTLASDSLAEVSYRRRPAFLNGEHVTGVWHLMPGDTVSTGGGRAYVTAKYLDSTRVGVMPNAKVVFQTGWVDLISGPLDVDVVRGTKHVEQIETPVGIVGLDAATGVVDLRDAQTDGSHEIVFSAKLGAFVFQAAGHDKGPPLFKVTIDKGDAVSVTTLNRGRSMAIKVTKGEARVQVGNDITVSFPQAARGTIACLPDKKEAQVSSTRGALSVTNGAGKNLSVTERSVVTVSYSSPLTDKLIQSKRGADSTVTVKLKTEAPVTEQKPTYTGKLPQDHQYQRVLREFMAGLKESDLDPGQLELTVTPPSGDKEQLYRTWLLSLDRIPRIGRKRSAPSVSAPARLFLLETIEGPDSIMRPPAWPEPLSWFANWDYPGNLYHDSKPLKLRAFVTASVLLMMIDHAQENTPELGVCRTDWMAHHLVLFCYTFPQVKDVLPPEVSDAYLAGVRKVTKRMLDWGPKGESIGMDMAASVGLYFAGEALADDETRKAAKAYAMRMFTDREFFHPAGYFVSHGGYDASYNGQARFYAVWLAMASNYEFAHEPLQKAYRLRAHLSLPEPDGTITGPTHFNTSASRDAYHDQYEWPFRDYSGAMLTDEAAHLTKLPTDEELASGGEMRIKEFKTQINENPGYAKPEELTVRPWSFRPWPNSWSFPQVINYAHDNYRAGSYARRAQLEKEKSPLLKLPLLRDENFIRHFEKEFTVAKSDRYAAVMHTGRIGAATRPGVHKYDGPYGFGGGQLSAFWTRTTGAVILGRRAGMSYDRTYDRLDEWRQWPIHAVSGERHNGTIFTTARIQQPDVYSETRGEVCKLTVSGNVPVEMLGQGKVLEVPINYRREFTVGSEGVRVSTWLGGGGENKVIELIETIPVYLRDLRYQRKQAPTAIEFQVGEKWIPASSTYHSNVTAVRLSRFEGKVRITFGHPRRVKLSSADWQDTYMSRAACRNVIIDLLDGEKGGTVFREARTLYSIIPEPPNS